MQDPLASWLYLPDSGYRDEGEMEVLMEMSEGMKAFAKKYNRSLDDPKLRGLYEFDLSARRDQAEIAYTAEMRGEMRGEKRGETKAYTAMIQNMLKKQLPIDLIYECASAPRGEIDAIIAKLRAGGGA